METKQLSEFLGKYDKLPTPKGRLKECVEMFLGFKVNDVSFRDGVVFVRAASIVKQEIFLKREKLIAFLRAQKLNVTINNIR